MSALPSDLIAMKDSPTYLPILRSVLKSQIQYLVEQLSGAGEETLVLSANTSDGLVDQFGSDSGKMFVSVYDDFKSEFLGFCQKRKQKRKQESPHKTVEAKRGRPSPAVLALPKTPGQPVQAVRLMPNVPKVSSARVITNQKTDEKVPDNIQVIQVSAGQDDSDELGESEEGFSDMGGAEFQYDEEEEEEPPESWEESDDNTPSSSQASSSRVKIAKVIPKESSSLQKLKRRKFTCEECGRACSSKWALRIHHLRHGEKTFKCDECEKMFFTKTELMQHTKLMHYEGERKPDIKYACEYCENLYARKDNLLKHIRIKHDNAEKQYKCDVCDKAFHLKYNLTTHQVRHGEKQFQCHLCAKSFFTTAEINQHLQHAHTEKVVIEGKEKEKDAGINYEKMFSKAMSCSECGKLFIRSDALKLHMMSHTGEYPHTCPFCGSGYRKKRSYITHLKSKHPDQYMNMEEI